MIQISDSLIARGETIDLNKFLLVKFTFENKRQSVEEEKEKIFIDGTSGWLHRVVPKIEGDPDTSRTPSESVDYKRKDRVSKSVIVVENSHDRRQE